MYIISNKKINDTFYCIVLSNNWYALDKSGNFEIMNNFNSNS